MTTTIWLLLLHGLLAIVLIGVITHQSVASMKTLVKVSDGFGRRYASTNPAVFVNAVLVTYVATFVLGSLIYPSYRLDVRIALSEMQLGWGIGLFEIKEHWAALGLALLPLYRQLWLPSGVATDRFARTAVTLILAIIVWFNFMVGHILNNFRGL